MLGPAVMDFDGQSERELPQRTMPQLTSLRTNQSYNTHEVKSKLGAFGVPYKGEGGRETCTPTAYRCSHSLLFISLIRIPAAMATFRLSASLSPSKTSPPSKG